MYDSGGIYSPLFSQSPPARAGFSLWFVAYTVLVYDYFCTLHFEINYVWPCEWTIGLVLFYFNRYLPFIDIGLFLRPLIFGSISQAECEWIFPLTNWFVVIGLISSESVIVLRTYAIWGRRPAVFWILMPVVTTIFCSMIAVTIWKTYIDYRRMQTFSLPDTSIPAGIRCQISALSFDRGGKQTLLIFYLLVFVGEAVLCQAAIVVLTAIKARSHVSKASPKWVSQLYKNGILYCVCMLAFSLLNSVMTFTAPPAYKPIFLPAQRTLHSVFCNRTIFLILKNRETGRGNSRQYRGERPDTYAHSVMCMFTSIRASTGYESENDGATWQSRAESEWIQ